MITPNALRQWMDFYQQNGLGSKVMGSMDNRNADAASWAMRMMQDSGQAGAGIPDYFGGGGGGAGGEQGQMAPFTPAERFNGQMPARSAYGSPVGSQINNYLARLIGGR